MNKLNDSELADINDGFGSDNRLIENCTNSPEKDDMSVFDEDNDYCATSFGVSLTELQEASERITYGTDSNKNTETNIVANDTPARDVESIANSVGEDLQSETLADLIAEEQAFRKNLEKRRRAILKRNGHKPTIVKAEWIKTLFQAVYSGLSKAEAIEQTRRIHRLSSDNIQNILQKSRPNTAKPILVEIVLPDRKSQQELKQVGINKYTLGDWSKKSISTIMTQLDTTKEILNTFRQCGERIASLEAELAKLKSEKASLQSTAELICNKQQAISVAKELSSKGMSQRTIVIELEKRGYKTSQKTISRWIQH